MSAYRYWTPAEDQRLRDAWPDYRAVAAALRRPALGCVRRAEKLGLPRLGKPYRRYTKAEHEAIRQRFPNEGAVRLAREQGRDRSCIVAAAARLGVSCQRRWTSADDRLLRQLHRENKSYRVMAERLDRTQPAIGKRLEGLGLTRHVFDPQQRRRKLASVREPSRNMVEARWAHERLKLGEHGWPPDLNPKEVAILNLIARRGPLNRRHISEGLGEPRSDDVRYQLRTHGGRSAVCRLMARRLLVRVRVQGEGRRAVMIYAMPLDAQQRRGTFPSVAEFNQRLIARHKTAPPEAPDARRRRLMQERRRLKQLIDSLDRQIARLEGRPARKTRNTPRTTRTGRRKQAA